MKEEELETDRQQASQALQEASARATEQLRRELDDCKAACADLDTKAADAATCLEAARWEGHVWNCKWTLSGRGDIVKWDLPKLVYRSQ